MLKVNKIMTEIEAAEIANFSKPDFLFDLSITSSMLAEA